jgi:hypothetical protein
MSMHHNGGKKGGSKRRVEKEGQKGGPGVGPRGREVNFDRTDVGTLKAPWSMPVHCCSQQTLWGKRCEGE